MNMPVPARSIARSRVSPRSGLFGIAAVGAVALAMTACASDADATASPETTTAVAGPASAPATTSEPSATAEASATVIANAPVPAFLDFTAVNVATGELTAGADFAGKDVIVWFWAPWCPTCLAESPDLVEAAANLPEGVTLIGVPGSSDVESSLQFVEDNNLGGFAHLYDQDGTIWRGFDVFAQPAFAFVNDDGTVELALATLDDKAIIAAAEDLASR